MYPNDVNTLFKKIEWLDNNKWQHSIDETNYNSINFPSDNFSNSQKILIHWLCYISDRQMPFAQIWAKGGFVYSDIVFEYCKKSDTFALLNPNIPTSFIKKKETNQVQYCFVSKSKIPKKNILINDYDAHEGDFVEFTPRYYPSDIKSILQTLIILEEFDKNIIKFFSSILDKYDNNDIVKKLGFALYLLSYYNIEQPRGIDYQKISMEVKKNKEIVMSILRNAAEFDSEFQKFMRDRRYKQKRMWCSLRDYIKSDEFTNFIYGGFRDIGRLDLVEKWKKLDKSELELPGDVWNNNSKFLKCVFKDLVNTDIPINSSQFIRKIYEKFKPHIIQGYPEMFDVTFDFVPKMCDGKNLCEYCIFNDNNRIEELCVNDSAKVCPVLLVSCGYKNRCNPKKCIVLNNVKR